MNTALETLLNHVGDAFRPERREYQAQIHTACMIVDLVQAHKMTFQQALEQFEADPKELLWAFDWMKLDNAAMNYKYDSDALHLYPHEVKTLEWLRRIMGEA